MRHLIAAAALLLPGFAGAGGHAVVQTSASTGHSSDTGHFAAGGSEFSAASSSSLSTSGWGGSNFHNSSWSSSPVGYSEPSSLRSDLWSDSIRSAFKRLSTGDAAPPVFHLTIPTLPCCASCTEKAAPAVAEAPRRTAKPVIIEVAPSDDVPPVRVLKGPTSVGHPVTLQ